MKFIDDLLGKEFLEKELYELLLFDIEEHRTHYLQRFIHIYFERSLDQKIKVSEIVYFNNGEELYQAERRGVEKREWFRTTDDTGALKFLLCRLDRTGYVSIVVPDREPRIQDCMLWWADEAPVRPKLTEAERSKAFQELAGILEVGIERQKLRKIRAV